MAPFTQPVQDAMNQTAKNFNQIFPDGIKTSFKTVSIVELGFAGNVLREVYRIGLDDGIGTQRRDRRADATCEEVTLCGRKAS